MENDNMTNENKEVLYKFQHITAGLVFLAGVAIHTTALIIGREKFLASVFTPLFDSVFGIPMAFAGIAGIVLWKNVRFDKTWKKISYRIGMFYLIASIPLHIRTIITRDTTYINKFPETYSYFIIPVMLFFSLVFLTQVKFEKS
jgi:hypothetical protein